MVNFKYFKDALYTQRTLFEENETESLLGPTPSNGDTNELGGQEVFQIKQYSNHPWGNLIVEEYINRLRVLSITDATGEEIPELLEWWEDKQVEKKLETALRDFCVGGTGYFEMYINDEGEPDLAAKSPKVLTVLYNDIVNDKYGELAYEEYTGADNKTYYKVWDKLNVTTYTNIRVDPDNQTEWTADVVSSGPHGFKHLPIYSINNLVTSSGAIMGDIELMKPVLSTLRIITNALTSGTYWAGLKELIITNFDRSATRADSETGEQINIYDEFMDELRRGVNDIIVLPGSEVSGQAGPDIKQTQESNLAALEQVYSSAKNTLSSISSLPLSRFDTSATPQNSDGALQANSPLDNKLDNKKKRVTPSLNLILKDAYQGITGEKLTSGLRVIWAASTPASTNNMADTVAKFVAAGVPLRWVVANVVTGYSPSQIADLLAQVGAKQDAEGQQDQQFLDAAGGFDAEGTE